MSKISRTVIGLFGWLFSIGFTLFVIGAVVLVVMFNHYAEDLPDYSQLAKYDPATLTRLYAGNGKLLAEYATEKRVFVPLSAIPKSVINGFLSAEDKNFYEHTGIDYTGLARAIRNNVVNYGQGKSLVGGSTITQQVVKNFLLSNEKSIERKIKEAILAMRISKAYSKDKILELYLNEIYLGLGSYGVAAAAQNYFDKSLDELTIEEIALLASEPKAPALYDPRKNYDAALERRNWVISRMKEDGRITQEQAQIATATPITLKNRAVADVVKADFFSEEVRRKLADTYGSEVLYTGGLVVKTTLDPNLQKIADSSLQKALIDYDKRHGYRGALAHIVSEKSWKEVLAIKYKENAFHLLENQKLAVVAFLDNNKAQLFFEDASNGFIPVAQMKWIGKKPSEMLRVGDVVIVSPAPDGEKNAFSLDQIPEVNGAMVVLDPHTGRVLAMSGGYSSGGTEFNRATQAKRQPGSSFKPFVYLAGLENGLTPSTLLLDAPVEMSQGAGQEMWRPSNYHNEYLGEMTMRVGLEKSRNTMTVRLAQMIGIDKVLEIGKRFGIYDEPQRNFSIVLGTAETSLVRMVNAYGMIANGGKKIVPSLIERIDDRHGKTIYRRDTRICETCTISDMSALNPETTPPEISDNREQVADPRAIYQLTSMLQGVATRGTAARSKEIGKIVAGKTGTTNDSLDTWFVGFTPDLVVGVFVGYDKPRTLGKKETGASVPLPAFISFMKEALANVTDKQFSVPRGIKLVQVDLHTGMPLDEFDTPETVGKVITEAFVVGEPIFVPGRNSPPMLSDLESELNKEKGDIIEIDDANQEPLMVNGKKQPRQGNDGKIKNDDEIQPSGSNNTDHKTGTGGLY